MTEIKRIQNFAYTERRLIDGLYFYKGELEKNRPLYLIRKKSHSWTLGIISKSKKKQQWVFTQENPHNHGWFFTVSEIETIAYFLHKLNRGEIQ